MRITRRTDYAIHLIADLSDNPEKHLGLRSLAERHAVSYGFARTVQEGLLKAGIITACRGINGGIRLARPLKEITLLEVFEAAQAPLDVAFSPKGSRWSGLQDCQVNEDIWLSTRSVLGKHLSSIRLHRIIRPK
ncbi:MAG: Rrf2 family transcriptional regulator [Coriobacteriales bacterium]|jgi:Rrf2 family protein|nr:Rrf2 family transcriptional regulator [Coriobacteriales bacterium]